MGVGTAESVSSTSCFLFWISNSLTASIHSSFSSTASNAKMNLELASTICRCEVVQLLILMKLLLTSKSEFYREGGMFAGLKLFYKNS